MSENERKITVNDKDYNYDDLKQEQSKYKIAKFTAEPIPGTRVDEEGTIRGIGAGGRMY